MVSRGECNPSGIIESERAARSHLTSAGIFRTRTPDKQSTSVSSHNAAPTSQPPTGPCLVLTHSPRLEYQTRCVASGMPSATSHGHSRGANQRTFQRERGFRGRVAKCIDGLRPVTTERHGVLSGEVANFQSHLPEGPPEVPEVYSFQFPLICCRVNRGGVKFSGLMCKQAFSKSLLALAGKTVIEHHSSI